MKSSPKPYGNSKSLNAYLLGLGGLASTAATASASIVVLEIGTGAGEFNIGGTNAGLGVGGQRSISNFPFSGEGTLRLLNQNGPFSDLHYTGLDGNGGLAFAINGGAASPRNFSAGQMISSAANFSSDQISTAFRYYYEGFANINSPNFGPGSYMGFVTNNGHFGWLEVTWDSGSRQFEILAGAYQSVAGEPIAAGAVPEPSSLALLLAGAAGLSTLRRRKKAAA